MKSWFCCVTWDAKYLHSGIMFSSYNWRWKKLTTKIRFCCVIWDVRKLHNGIMFLLCNWGWKKINKANIIPLDTRTMKIYFHCYFFHPQLHNENTILVCNFSRGIFGIWLMCTHMGNTISKIEVQIAIPQWFGSRPVIHRPLLLRLLPCFKRNTKEPTTTNLSLSPSPLSLSAVPLSIVNSIVQKGRHHLLIEQFFELFFLILFIF